MKFSLFINLLLIKNKIFGIDNAIFFTCDRYFEKDVRC